MKKSVKRAFKVAFLVLLVAIIAVPAYILFNAIPIERSHDLNDYESHRHSFWLADQFMPELDSLVGTTEIRYGYQATNIALWLSQTMALTVRYSPDAYTNAKAAVLSEHEFLSAPVVTTGVNSGDYIVDNSFEYKGYTFHTITGYEDSRYFGIIGLNDTACSVAYLYYSDPDRDFIAEQDDDLDSEMRNLIDKEFNWKPF